MITTVSTWRCKCGVRIKAVGETERDNPLATAIATCPKCGDEQSIYAGRIVSIGHEEDETARTHLPE